MVERLKETLARIPGYSGYRAKEQRRDDDRAVRERLAASLDAMTAQVEAVSRGVANKRRLDLVQPSEALFQRMDLLARRVRTAPSGYAGLYDQREIDELALDQLRRFDEQILADVTTLQGYVASLQEHAAASAADLTALLASVSAEVDRLATLWDHRSQVVETARPSSERDLASILDARSTSGAATSELDSIQSGDAIALLGDDFIVSSVIDVEAPPHRLHLARLDEGPDWLLRFAGADSLVARVTEAPQGSAPSGEPIAKGRGRMQARGREGTAAETAVQFSLSGDSKGNGPIWLTLDWGQERRRFSGERLHSGDVDVFGQPAS